MMWPIVTPILCQKTCWRTRCCSGTHRLRLRKCQPHGELQRSVSLPQPSGEQFLKTGPLVTASNPASRPRFPDWQGEEGDQ